LTRARAAVKLECLRGLFPFTLVSGLCGLAAVSLTAAPAGPARLALAPTRFPGWQTHHVSAPVVVRDPARGLWRMYYTGAATDQRSAAAWDLRVTGVATSRDLARWRYPDDYEPVLIGRRFMVGDVVDTGSPPAFDAITASITSVMREGATWRAWYTGWNGDERRIAAGRVEAVHFRIGCATSRDGARWTKQPGAFEGAALGLGARDEPDSMSAAHPSVLKVGPEYHLWYEAYDGTAWRIAHARSTDGTTWTKRGAVLEPGTAGERDRLGVRHPVVRKTASGFEMWYQGRSASTPAFHVLRATSADGERWTAAPDVALRTDPPLAGDERIAVGSVVPRPDGSLLVFFARETARARAAPWGEVEDRTTAIYSQVVRP
jgi:hypothetical protein